MARSTIGRGVVFGLSILCAFLTAAARAQTANLVANPAFTDASAAGHPVHYTLTGDAVYGSLTDRFRDAGGFGVALTSAGGVWQSVKVNPANGRWYRFSFRGLPMEHFNADDDEALKMVVEFFGRGGTIAYDGKSQPLNPIIRTARRDLTVNGDYQRNGAAVWHVYQLDFYLPFPQIDTLKLGVDLHNGEAEIGGRDNRFLITDFSLEKIDQPAELAHEQLPTTQPTTLDKPRGTLIPLGGRWYYDAPSAASAIPTLFNYANADRLLYFDGEYEVPFAGNMTSVLRAGDKDVNGNIVSTDTPVLDNVTIRFDATSLIMHTHGLPNHPTGKYPGFNPNYLQEQDSTYYIPIDPKENPNHVATTTDNSNHALPMGPIGVAINGVVFYNPFDANSQDASNIMDSCCGHPNPFGQYHYHKYPVCINSPWADQGQAHSPVIGFAFDGYAIYGPYAAKDVMAKDVSGDEALNDFNATCDKDRGWHYAVTPGKFPYIIGGYWGFADSRDTMRRGSRGMGGNGDMGGNGGGMNGGGRMRGGGGGFGGPGEGGGPNGGGGPGPDDGGDLPPPPP